MLNELISVIVPVYNVEEYLAACIESILLQSYDNLEIILVDDGSTDKSGEICDVYEKKDNRITVIHQNNGGLSLARNNGIFASKGSYISFVDSDDLIQRDFIETLYDSLQQSKCELACCEMICFFDKDINKLYQYWDNDSSIVNKFQVFDAMELLESSFYQHISITGAYQKMYKRNLFETIEFPVGRYFEDLATTYEFIEKAKKIAIINKKKYGYRIRNDSIMQQSFSMKKMDCIWVSEMIYNNYINNKIISKSAICASFRINRLVFDQIPIKEKEARDQVWNCIKKYRSSVVCDSKAKKSERLLAGVSYFGRNIFCIFIRIFRVVRSLYYKVGLHRGSM